MILIQFGLVESPQPLNYQSRADFKKETGGLFGPDHRHVWAQFADQFGARLETGEGMLPRPGVTIRAAPWVITLDVNWSGEYPFTRMRAQYINPERFRFTIWREGFFSKIGKLLGMEDIQVGRDEFDREFMVRSNQPDHIRRLLSDAPLRQLFHVQPSFEMIVKDGEQYLGNDYAKPIDELHYRTFGVVRNSTTLHNIYDLFEKTLGLLREMGAAREIQ